MQQDVKFLCILSVLNHNCFISLDCTCIFIYPFSGFYALGKAIYINGVLKGAIQIILPRPDLSLSSRC